jgi:hypothetical protein
MFATLGVVLLVLDDLEEDENKQDDMETIVADALRSVLVEAINRYNQFKRMRIDIFFFKMVAKSHCRLGIVVLMIVARSRPKNDVDTDELIAIDFGIPPLEESVLLSFKC